MDDLRGIDTRQRIGQVAANAQENNQVHAQVTTQNGVERLA
jgi:hypothetical protein